MAWNGYQWVPTFAAPYSPPTGAYERMRTKANIAVVLYALAAGAAVFAIGALLHRYNVVSGIYDALSNGGPGLDLNAKDTADGLVNAAVWTYFVVVIAATIALLVFLHGAQRNNRVLGASDLRFTPGWVVGWTLIPLANVVMHWLVLSDVERTSRDPRGRPTRLERLGLRVFWGVPALVVAAITAFVLQVVGNSYSSATADDTTRSFADLFSRAHTRDALFTAMFAVGVVIVALYVVVLRRILANQEQAARQAGVSR